MQNLKSALRCAIVVFVTVMLSQYFAVSEKFWMPLSALLVMQTPTGSSLRHGLQRFLLIVVCVIIGSVVLSWLHEQAGLMHTIYMRVNDITLGAVIGMSANLLIFPSRPDVEFRQKVIPILNSYSTYLRAIEDFVMQQTNSEVNVQESKMLVEEALLNNFPIWVYEQGFNIALRQGHRHFLIMVERVGQLLFSMHHIARHEFDIQALKMISMPLSRCMDQANQMLANIIAVLELRRLDAGMLDFEEDLCELEKSYQIPSLEMLDLSAHYGYFAAFVYDLKDLRMTLLKLLEALQ